MTDIVERLLEHNNTNREVWGICAEAADEIKRLRLALGPSVSWADEIKRQREDHAAMLDKAVADVVRWRARAEQAEAILRRSKTIPMPSPAEDRYRDPVDWDNPD